MLIMSMLNDVDQIEFIPNMSSSTRTEDSVQFSGPLKVVFWPSPKTDRSHQTARVTGKTTGEKKR